MNTRIQSKKASSLSSDWHPADIVAEVRKAGWSLRRLAKHHGYSPSMITKALRQPYPNAERLIAHTIGMEPEEIWPSRYDDRRPMRGIGGAPTHKSGPHAQGKCITHGQRDNVNSGEVAQT